MSEYMIMTDSTVDLPKEYLTEELGVPYIPLTYLIDGQSYEDMIGLTGEEFFAKVKAGSMPTTSQINPEQAREALEPYLKEGKDILYIAFSSGLSGTYNSIRMAAEELQEEYPEQKLIIIDSLCACMGEGLLVYKAVQLKRAGKSLEHHLSAIFDGNEIIYTAQAVTEGNKKPDFIFPSQASYHDMTFPTDKLISLAAKTTCKDRWRQVINEADRLRDRPKYLCTLQQGISPAQMDEMQSENVILVVPRQYITSYPADRQDRIWTLSKFVSYVREVEGL